MKRGFLNSEQGPRNIASTRPAGGGIPVKLNTIGIPRTTKPPPEAPFAGDIPKVKQLDFRITTLPATRQGPTTLCLLFPEAKEKILALPGFPAPLPSYEASFDQPFHLGTVQGMVGMGVYASVDRMPGDRILCERPILIFPAAMPNVEGQIHPYDLFKTMVGHLAPAIQAYFYSLHDCKSNDAKSIRGIIDTNALGIGGLPGFYNGAYGAVGPRMSRFNHSCVPNAEYRWDLPSFAFYVRAVRPIKKGEQICIAYCDVFQPRVERQKELQSKYSFKCGCPCCALPDDQSALSDARRADLLKSRLELYHTTNILEGYDIQLEKWATDLSIPEEFILDRSRNYLLMMETEGAYIEGVWSLHCEVLCKALCAIEHREDVVFLAKKAAAISKAFTGEDGGWGRVAEAPEKTAWWGRRKRLAK